MQVLALGSLTPSLQSLRLSPIYVCRSILRATHHLPFLDFKAITQHRQSVSLFRNRDAGLLAINK